MKIIHLKSVVLSCGLAASTLLTVSAAPIRLKSGDVDTSSRVATSAAASIYTGDDATRVYLIQCDGTIEPAWRSTIEQAGGKVLGYVPDNAYLVAAKGQVASDLAAQVKYAYFGEYRPEYKISSTLSTVLARARTLKASSSDERFKASAYAGEFIISIFPFAQASDVAEKISKLEGCVVTDAAGDVVRAKLSDAAMGTVLTWPEVEWLEPFVPENLFNNVAAEAARMNVETVWPSGASNLGLTGEGQIVAVCDTGLDSGNTSTLHQDVRGRVTRTYCYGRSNSWSDPDGHGTHVVGSVLGNGTKSSGTFKGMAYKASLIFQSALTSSGGLYIPPDYKELFQAAYNTESGKSGARIHSNSWGSGSQQAAWRLGVYTSGSRAIDQFMFEHPDMLIFFAAGNEGVDKDADGVIDLDSLANQATAKNCMTVGAAENQRTKGGYSQDVWASGSWASKFLGSVFKNDYISRPYDGEHQGVAAFSSRGPCDDGRIKPDIVAPGTDIISLQSSVASDTGWDSYNSSYAYMGGTSMATPLTAGAAALVRQWLVEKKGFSNPDGATVKAVMLAGAKSLTPGQYGTGATREIPASYPNNVEGWGQVNLGNSLANTKGVTVLDGKIIAYGETQEYRVSVASAGSPLAIVMAYADAPAELSASAQLVNDLDLTVTTPSGRTLYPNSRTSADRINNVEGVRISSAEKGIYTVKVYAYSITSPMSTSWTNGKSNACRYSVAVNGASQSTALEASTCFLSNQSKSLDAASAVNEFNEGETIYSYLRVSNPGSVEFTGGFSVKYELFSGSVAKGSGEKTYQETIAANGHYDIQAYAWDGLQNLSVGSYTYRITLSASGMEAVQKSVSFTVVELQSPLTSVVVSGASTVGGGSKSTYTCRARLANGSEVTAKPVWTIDSGNAYASIDQEGVLWAFVTDGAHVVVLRATCQYNGVVKSGTATVAIIPGVSLPVALDCPSWTLTSGGDAEWFGEKTVTNDGVDAGQSGAITHNQSSWFETTVTGPGTLSFWYRVSTEVHCDKLVVSSGGVNWFEASGQSPWRQQSIVFGSGSHTIRFAYVKDVNGSEAEDAVYLDQLSWTTTSTPVSLSITGGDTVSAGFSLQLGCVATMSDGTTPDVTEECDWSVSSGSSYASITASGLLTAMPSTVDRSVVVQAEYMSGGVTKLTTRRIVITGVENPPTTPSITRSGEGDTSAAVLGWTSADNATAYRVYRSTSTVRPSSPIATLGNVLSYRDTSASPGVEYQYWVSAVNTSGEAVSSSAVAYRAVQLTLAEGGVSFDSAGGTTNVTIKSNAPVSCSAEVDWLTVSYASSSVALTAQPNYDGMARTNMVTVIAAGATAHPLVKVIAIYQVGKSKPVETFPDLTFAAFSEDWDADYALYTATSEDSAHANRLFDVGDAIVLRYGWGNFGDGVASGAITNVIEVGCRRGDVESDSVDECDIDLDVLTRNEFANDITLGTGESRAEAFSPNEWKSLQPGVYIARAMLNEAETLTETDYSNNNRGFRFAVRKPITIREALDCDDSTLVLSTTSDQWYGTEGIGYDGDHCAMTKLTGDGSRDVLTATVSGAGTLSFVYKVATEASCDTLSFTVDGEELLEDSGVGEWKKVSFDIVAGSHTFSWVYAKDAFGSDGDDCVYLDNLVWTPARSGEPPSDLAATQGNYYYVKLTWTEDTTALAYSIERSCNGTNEWVVVYTGPYSSEIRDTPELGRDDYKYRIKSLYSDGESAWSDYLCVGWRNEQFGSTNARYVSASAGADGFLVPFKGRWSASADQDWIHITNAVGTNETKLTFSFDENSGRSRKATLSLVGAPNGGHEVYKKVYVTQKAFVGYGRLMTIQEATDCSLTFENDREHPWFGQSAVSSDGLGAARSAEISCGCTSRLDVALARSGTLKFVWGSCSTSSDKLYCLVGGKTIDSISGCGGSTIAKTNVMNWAEKVVQVPAGGAVVSFVFIKSATGTDGLDAAFVDNIVWTPDADEIVPPEDWFKKHPDLLVRLGVNDYAVAAKMQSPGSVGSGGKTAADGSPWLVWMDYACGTDPLDSNSKFLATIKMVDGTPKVEWSPKLSDEETKLRNYLISGRKAIDETDWTPVAEGHENEFNFFRVSVELQ